MPGVGNAALSRLEVELCGVRHIKAVSMYVCSICGGSYVVKIENDAFGLTRTRSDSRLAPGNLAWNAACHRASGPTRTVCFDASMQVRYRSGAPRMEILAQVADKCNRILPHATSKERLDETMLM